MSVKVMALVWDLFPERGSIMMTALALADHADHDGGRIFPSIEAIARKTRQAERTIQYHFRRLEQIGWLELVRKFDGGRGVGGQGNEYRMPVERLRGADADALPAAEDERGANSAPLSASDGVGRRSKRGANSAPLSRQKGVQATTKRGATAVAPESSREPSPPPIVPPHGVDLLSLGQDEIRAWFERVFWPAYPVHEEKAAAVAELIHLKPDAELLDCILADIRRRLGVQAAADAKGQFHPAWPYARRYLRQRRWEDGRSPAAEAPVADYRCRCGAAGTIWSGRAWLCRDCERAPRAEAGAL